VSEHIEPCNDRCEGFNGAVWHCVLPAGHELPHRNGEGVSWRPGEPTPVTPVVPSEGYSEPPVPDEWVRAFRAAAHSVYDGPCDETVDYEWRELCVGIAAVRPLIEAAALRREADALEARYPSPARHPVSVEPAAMAARGVRRACGLFHRRADEIEGLVITTPDSPVPPPEEAQD
jgi:hypothetical protein